MSPRHLRNESSIATCERGPRYDGCGRRTMKKPNLFGHSIATSWVLLAASCGSGADLGGAAPTDTRSALGAQRTSGPDCPPPDPPKPPRPDTKEACDACGGLWGVHGLV